MSDHAEETKRAMVKWKRDVIYGIALEVVCVLCYFGTRNLPTGTAKIWQARADVYIWLWIIILAILSAILIATAVIKKDQTPCEPVWTREGVVTAGAFFLYLFVMSYIGFILSTMVFLTTMILYYSWKMDKLHYTGSALIKKIILYIVAALVTTFVTYWIFTSLLDVRSVSYTHLRAHDNQRCRALLRRRRDGPDGPDSGGEY